MTIGINYVNKVRVCMHTFVTVTSKLENHTNSADEVMMKNEKIVEVSLASLLYEL